MAPLPQPSEHVCETTGLAYLRAGETGHPVVLLHGWGGFKEIWWSAMAYTGQHYQVFAPDMPGHQNSPLGQTHSMPQLAHRIAQFCQARGLHQIALVGHSMGGNVAIELALARPDLVQQLVLVAPALQGSRLPVYTRSYLVEAHGYAALRLAHLISSKTGRLGFSVPHDHGGGLLFPALRRFAYESKHDPGNMHRLLRSLMNNTLVERLAFLAMPTLVVTGEFDPLVPPALSRQVAASIPGASYHELRRAAHNPMDERPAEWSAMLLDFLHKTC